MEKVIDPIVPPQPEVLSLSRPPRGIDPGHPLMEDLRRKDFVTLFRYSEADVLADDFLTRYAADCQQISGYVGFLTRALDLPY